MRILILSGWALSISAATVLLTACGGSQPLIGAPGAMQQGVAIAAPESSSAAGAAHSRDGVPSPLGYTLLYTFRGGDDGHHPSGALVDLNGTLYGTTDGGGGSVYCLHGCGSVFTITTGGRARVLYSFGGADGDSPQAGLVNVRGTLYGTTELGGAYGAGTVFSITTAGTLKVLHSFVGGSDGSLPDTALIDVNGVLYGATYDGGTYNSGTVFSVTTGGMEKVVHSFVGGSDGAFPYAGLVDVKGTLYGSTAVGGSGSCSGGGCGTVYSITADGTENVLYSFRGGTADGAYPQAALADVNGRLYGTTTKGGSECASLGCGTVFSITTGGIEKVLHSFGKKSDGAIPYTPLVNVNGKLYGTTGAGGSGCGSYGCGTIFSITTDGTERVLYSFRGGSDGNWPQAGLVDVNGTLYGTTYYGGVRHGRGYGHGIVFALTHSDN